ncbi:16176_t:CDS:2 [Racocetra persica]|uniref:16176_t:CDS:1 n=1 Tax=Racocetra persica TaxID=160502 RepID=A0ACA9R2W3_9GLOM|nr:16176_t:CDS:2 [Racocetra persica]
MSFIPEEFETNVSDGELYYEDIYFDSDLDNETGEVDKEQSNSTEATYSIKKQKLRKKLTEDELFYDPKMDDDDELWMKKKLAQHDIETTDQTTKETINQIAAKETDAILSCPMCFTVLSYHTQKHSLYSTQYRAIFVENCKVNRSERLIYTDKENLKAHNKNKNKRLSDKQKQRPNSTDENTLEKSTAKGEIYYPVECEICGTKVAVMNDEEVFHFFNVIPS